MRLLWLTANNSNPSFAKQASIQMQRSTETRKPKGLAGFLLPNEMPPHKQNL
jgi:hypothetical protein